MELTNVNEKILFVSHMNDSELKWSLAIRGNGCFNFRVYGPEQLARLALLRIGRVVTNSISEDEELVLFKKVEHEKIGLKSKYDIHSFRKIVDTIRHIRYLVPYGDVSKARRELREKLESLGSKSGILSTIYKNYIDKLVIDKLVDCIVKKYDSVLLIRKAIADYSKLNLKNNPMIETQFVVLKEFPLSPLESELLNVISGKRFKEIKLEDLLSEKERENKESILFRSFNNIDDEVKSIINDIIDKNNESIKHVDQCVIAVTNPEKYVPKILEIAKNKHIPVTFGCGIPIKETNPGKLLELFKDCLVRNKEPIKDMIGNEKVFCRKKLEENLRKKLKKDFPQVFLWKKFLSLLSDLKLSNIIEIKKSKKSIGECHNEEDKYRNCLIVLAEELSLKKHKVVEFIKEYSVIRGVDEYDEDSQQVGDKLNEFNNYFDEKSLRKIDAVISLLKIADGGRVRKRTIDVTLDTLVLGNDINSKEGKLYVTDIRNAFFSHREFLYIAGACDDNFMSKSEETSEQRDVDKIIDGELKLLNSSFKNLANEGFSHNDLTKHGIIMRNRKMCCDLIDYFSKFRVVRWVSFYSIRNKGNSELAEQLVYGNLDDYVVVERCTPNNIDNKKFDIDNKTYEMLEPSESRRNVEKTGEILDPIEVPIGQTKPSDGKNWGSLVHKLIEIFVISNNVIKKPSHRALAGEVIRQGDYLLGNVPNKEVRDGLCNVVEKLRNEKSEWKNILSSESREYRAYCEVPYSFKEKKEEWEGEGTPESNTNEENNVIRIWNGKIDLVYHTKEDERWHIIDYKTDQKETNRLNYDCKNQLFAYTKHANYITGKDFDSRICHIKFASREREDEKLEQ